MRRLRCSGPLIALVFSVVLAAPRVMRAQQPATEGALFLLLPIGARAVGAGQAIVADQPGSEAVWWNPAAIARTDRAEAAIHHSATIVATGDAVTIVLPSSLLGVLAIGANILNYGRQEITDTIGTTGFLLPRNVVYAASYATPVGRRMSAGITYKIVQLRLDCSGGCSGIPTVSASSSALDAGVQADLTGIVPVHLGAAIRNVGPRLQVNDKAQADPLPTRIQVGATYDIPHAAKDVTLRLATDVLGDVHLESPSLRIGATATYRGKAYLRGGYLMDRGDGDGDGPAIGFGLSTGSLVADIARVMRGFSAEADKAPTYFSLRYLF
jgi:hypothetical protein